MTIDEARSYLNQLADIGFIERKDIEQFDNVEIKVMAEDIARRRQKRMEVNN